MYKMFILLSIIMSIFSAPNHRLNFETRTLKRYKMDLSLPIKERYREVLTDFKTQVQTISSITSKLPLHYIMTKLGKYLLKNQSPDWVEYIEAVSEYCDIPISTAVMMSITYDLGCTSTIVQDKNKKVFMGRNLDFLTYFIFVYGMYEVEYYKKDTLVYIGVELAGFRGAINAIKPGKFAVALNLRSKHYKIQNIKRVYQGYRTPNYNMMKVVEEANSYDEAFNMLSSTPLTAAVYYSLAGIENNQGVIITRSNKGVDRLDKLNVEEGKWYLVITNTDLDQVEDMRRKPTEERIKTIGWDMIDFNNLFEIMSDYPTNNLSTIYTTIQSAQGEGYFNTTLRLP